MSDEDTIETAISHAARVMAKMIDMEILQMYSDDEDFICELHQAYIEDENEGFD